MVIYPVHYPSQEHVDAYNAFRAGNDVFSSILAAGGAKDAEWDWIAAKVGEGNLVPVVYFSTLGRSALITLRDFDVDGGFGGVWIDHADGATAKAFIDQYPVSVGSGAPFAQSMRTLYTPSLEALGGGEGCKTSFVWDKENWTVTMNIVQAGVGVISHVGRVVGFRNCYQWSVSFPIPFVQQLSRTGEGWKTHASAGFGAGGVIDITKFASGAALGIAQIYIDLQPRASSDVFESEFARQLAMAPSELRGDITAAKASIKSQMAAVFTDAVTIMPMWYRLNEDMGRTGIVECHAGLCLKQNGFRADIYKANPGYEYIKPQAVSQFKVNILDRYHITTSLGMCCDGTPLRPALWEEGWYSWESAPLDAPYAKPGLQRFYAMIGQMAADGRIEKPVGITEIKGSGFAAGKVTQPTWFPPTRNPIPKSFNPATYGQGDENQSGIEMAQLQGYVNNTNLSSNVCGVTKGQSFAQFSLYMKDRIKAAVD